jgi:hypothetical protein
MHPWWRRGIAPFGAMTGEAGSITLRLDEIVKTQKT